MARSDAEGRRCEICQRHMLAGETYRYMDHLGRHVHRRPVCALCQRPAAQSGWTTTPELPSPDPDLTGSMPD